MPFDFPPPGTTFDTRHKVNFRLPAIDDAGIERPIENLQAQVTGEGRATVEPDGSITFETGSNPGDSMIAISADALIGPGDVFVTETGTFHVATAPIPLASRFGAPVFGTVENK